ncbi:MAG TPA: tetratricopeptide repeat protein, partial [Candidatus Binatia bacterium]|nr:tetratricopeptide repeat protein [Candidatus Binatia bacterium]
VLNAGEPVSRETLFASVWTDAVVTDDALTTCIQELRKAFADDARQPRFIETRHRRGYRFVAELCTAAAGVARPSPARDCCAIAVLPFADMSPGRDQDYLCEGLAEEIINALTRMPGLRVASRTASFRFRSPGADVQELGQLLGVANLLEGSVRKSDNRLRITVQLIETVTGYHHWSQRFDCLLDDVFAIEDEIAERVVASLRGGVLCGREWPAHERPKTSADAYEYYLRGRQHLHRMTQAALETSEQMFERAIELDPRYAPAWGCLSVVYATLYEWFGAREDDLAKADHASRNALEMAPGMAEPHVARGFVLSLLRRYDDAAQEFEQAIRLNPNFFEAYYYFARACFAHGETERAAELFHRAGESRREDFQSPMLEGLCLRMLGRVEEFKRAIREGVCRAERTLMLNPYDSRALSIGSVALFDDGQVQRAMEWSQRSLELYPDDMSALINAACLHAKAGHKEQALALLERAFGRGWGKRDWIEHDPDYDILRDDPRFHGLLAKLK